MMPPKATTQGEPAFVRPVDGQAAPRLKEGTPGPVTTTTATPTRSAAAYASAASPLNGRKHQLVLVNERCAVEFSSEGHLAQRCWLCL